MVTLGSEIRLLVTGDSTVVGLTRGTTNDEILVTTSNSVILYEVSSQKPLTSWSASFNHFLQIPAIYDPLSKCFMTVVNGNIIRKWTAAGDQIESGTKITLSSSVAALFSVDDSYGVILVYENGKIEFMNDSPVEFSLKFNSQHRIHLVRMLKCHEKLHLAILSVGQDAMDVICHHVIFGSGGHSLHAYNTVQLPKNAIPKSMLLRTTPMDAIEAAVLWPDDSLSIGLLKSEKDDIPWKALVLLQETGNEKLADMVFLKNNIVFIYLNSSSDAVCCSYDMKFKTLTVKKVLKTSTSVSQLYMRNIDDKILVILGNELLLLPYTEDISNLSKVIGIHTKENTAVTLGFEPPLTWTTEGLRETELTPINLSRNLKKNFSKRFLDKVRILESHGTSERATCIEILQEIIETKDYNLLLDALKYYRDIPEAMLVNVLHCFLSSVMEQDCSVKNKLKGLVESADIRHPVIDQIISIQLNDVFMLDHLRKLSLDEAMVLLTYLLYLLEQRSFQNDSILPDMVQIVDWISMVLDAHFHQLIVTRNEEVYSFLNKLHSVVNVQCKCLEDFVILQEIVTSLLSQEKLCQEQSQQDYSIETLKFE